VGKFRATNQRKDSACVIDRLRNRDCIPLALQVIEGNPVDVGENDKRGNFIESVRLGVNDFGDRNGVSDQAEEIDFFAAERGIVLIDASTTNSGVESSWILKFALRNP